MAVRWTWRAVVLIAFVASSGPIWAQAQRPDDLDALSRQVVQLYQAGKYVEATGTAKRLLSLAERKFGADHPSVAADLNNLALHYDSQGRWVGA